MYVIHKACSFLGRGSVAFLISHKCVNRLTYDSDAYGK